MKNMFLVIVNEKSKARMSGLKANTPKLVAAMKLIAEKYTAQLGETYKVRRAIITPKGIKLV